MAQDKPLHPFPLTIGRHLTELLDPKGFDIIQIDTMPILQGYSEKLGIDHWAGNDQASYEMTDEQAAATTLHTFVSYNAHHILVEALDGIKAKADGPAYALACAALAAVEVLTATAQGVLYEESGEVRE